MSKLVDSILAALRKIESGGDYKIRNNSSSASGAYQFLDSTWLGAGGGKYAPRAYLATPAQQDEIARAQVEAILKANDNKPSAVAETWYVGHVGKPPSYVPPGNSLSVGDYLKRFENAFIAAGGLNATGGNPVEDVLKGPTKAVSDAVSKVAREVLEGIAGLLGAAVDPFVEGLKRLSIIGLAVGGGVTLVVLGAWRGVKAPS